MKTRLAVLAGAIFLAGCGSGAPSLAPSPLAMPAVSFAAQSAGPADSHETPAPMPTPDPAPATVTISIVGSFGPAAFMPNPIQAAAGSEVQWTNNDLRPHHIVLGDGTDVGLIEPGMSSAPVVLANATASYRCTLHPSMVGSITDVSAPTMPPVEEPPSTPPYDPPDDGYYY